MTNDELKSAIKAENDTAKRAHLRRQLLGPEGIAHLVVKRPTKRDERRALAEQVANLDRTGAPSDETPGLTSTEPVIVEEAIDTTAPEDGPAIVADPLDALSSDEGPAIVADPKDLKMPEREPVNAAEKGKEKTTGEDPVAGPPVAAETQGETEVSVSAAKAGGSRGDRLKALSEGLDDGDFTSDGKPQVNAVNALLDEGEDSFTAEERDTLWGAEAG